jgi:hypothetical protein
MLPLSRLRSRTDSSVFVIDAEAIIRDVDGYSDFNTLHSNTHSRMSSTQFPGELR